jgi:glycosyltransferase involved in cell wall biosynthesis
LITGFIDNPFPYFKNSYKYILSSLFEGFPNAMTEALSCGCPVIAADCKSGPREILYKECNIMETAAEEEFADYGILIPSFNSKESWDASLIEKEEKLLSEMMNKLILDKNLRNNYSLVGLERVKEFDYITCLNKFKALIDA